MVRATTSLAFVLGLLCAQAQAPEVGHNNAIVILHKPTVPEIACAIAAIEGWNQPGSLTRRLHNPGALVYVGQKTAKPGLAGYAWFPDDDAGWAAERRDLALKVTAGMDLPTIARVWAQAETRQYLALLRKILAAPPAWCPV